MTVPDDARLQTEVAHSARVWNYLLGGTDNFAADRVVGDMIVEMFPAMAEVARQQRGFLSRVVTFLARDAGIRQFLDIGAGLPTANNTHELAQALAPTSRVVYVDNDPLVLAHADALLVSAPEGACAYVDADIRDPRTILSEASRTLDFNRPVALIMLSILGQLPDSDDPWAIVRELLDALPSDSYLALSDGTNLNHRLVEAIDAYNRADDSVNSYHLRAPEEIVRYFHGLQLVGPGVIPSPQWRPTATPADTTDPANNDINALAGLARKP